MNTPALPAGVSLTRIDAMTGGWFVGGFTPAAYQTTDAEVAVQYFPAGYRGEAHYHRIATEVTLLLAGQAEMAGVRLRPGDIITLSPGTSAAFYALEACVTVVVKHPGALNDKYVNGDTPPC